MDLKTVNIIRSSLLDLPIIKPITIEGPVSVSEYIVPMIEPKRIYLFGDEHVRNKKCLVSEIETVSFENFLEYTFEENQDKIIDVFLEQEFISSQIPRYWSTINLSPDYNPYIQQIMKYFSSCLEPEKFKCKYKNVRFHYSDIRNTTELLRYLSALYIDILNFNQNSDKKEWITQLLPLIKKDIPKIYAMLLKTTVEEIFKDTKIQKQFDSIRNEHYRNYINKWYISMFQQTKTHLLDRLKTMMSYDGINDKFTTEWINEFGGVLVDAYVVGRIFRSFRDGPDPRYIIVYLGYWHTNNIKTLFDSLRFFNVGNNYSNTKDDNFQCLMLGLRIPFFNLNKNITY